MLPACPPFCLPIRPVLTHAPFTIPLTCQQGRAVSEEEVPASLLQRGDHLKVLPGARLPADGAVVEGRSWVDESMLTGRLAPAWCMRQQLSTLVGRIAFDKLHALPVGKSESSDAVACLPLCRCPPSVQESRCRWPRRRGTKSSAVSKAWSCCSAATGTGACLCRSQELPVVLLCRAPPTAARHNAIYRVPACCCCRHREWQRRAPCTRLQSWQGHNAVAGGRCRRWRVEVGAEGLRG